MAEWYYSNGDEQKGPVTLDELKEMVESRSLASSDRVWCEGQGDWMAADQCDDLKELFKTVAPASTLRKAYESASQTYLAAGDEWANERLEMILDDGEEIIFQAKGRIETRPATLFGSLFFWIAYFAINYFSFLYTLRARITAQLVLTDRRLIMLTNNAILWPLWKFEFSQAAADHMIPKAQVASISPAIKTSFWFIKAVGVTVETSGGRQVTFNGLNKDDFKELMRGLRKFMRSS